MWEISFVKVTPNPDSNAYACKIVLIKAKLNNVPDWATDSALYMFSDYQIAVETILNIQTVATLGKEDNFYEKYMEAVAEMYS